MKVYHGSLDIVEFPKILLPNRKLDYGSGFYTTTSEKQSNEWVKRRMFEKGASQGFTNVYEFDEGLLSELKCLMFKEPDEDWAEFVLSNRMQDGFNHDYDVVYGPVANDKVYLQFGLYEVGAISVETLIKELKTYKLIDQYLFHTENALRALNFIKAIKIES